MQTMCIDLILVHLLNILCKAVYKEKKKTTTLQLK